MFVKISSIHWADVLLCTTVGCIYKHVCYNQIITHNAFHKQGLFSFLSFQHQPPPPKNTSPQVRRHFMLCFMEASLLLDSPFPWVVSNQLLIQCFVTLHYKILLPCIAALFRWSLVWIFCHSWNLQSFSCFYGLNLSYIYEYYIRQSVFMQEIRSAGLH